METPINKKIIARKSSLKTPTRRENLQLLSTDQLVKLRQELLSKEKEVNKKISDLKGKDSNTDLNTAMQALHRYNDMKDFTEVVLGYIADVQHATVAAIHQQYDLPSD